MSTLVHSLPLSSFHSGRDQVFTPPQSQAAFDYVGLNLLPHQIQYSTSSSAQTPYIQRQKPLPSPNLRRTPSRGPKITFRSPSMRDRTPIQHHRSSLPQDRSTGRQEALLAYVSGQRNQQNLQQHGQQVPVLTSQTAPGASIMFQTPNYGVPASEAYVSQSLYYHSPQLQHNVPQYMSEPHIYGSDTSQMQYYPLQSSSTHMSASNRQAFNPQGSLYAPPALPSNPQQLQPAIPNVGSSIVQSSLPTPTPLESSREEYSGPATRPKPQCFEHGCNGREFSTFSNLLRHQRERSGNATKSICPHCGTEFTRTTARNGHLTSGKCKGKPDQGQNGSDPGT